MLGPGTEEIEGRELAMFASQGESWESVLFSTVHVFSTIELCAEKSLELYILGVNMYLHRNWDGVDACDFTVLYVAVFFLTYLIYTC